MKAILTAFALLVPTTAMATPIAYFDCQVPSPQGPKVAKIAIDRDRKEVIFRLPSENLTRYVPAVVTDKTVTFVVTDEGGETTFTVNRSDLSVERYRRVGIEKSAVTRGSCSATSGP
jgi:hypothetical protein